MKRNLTASEVVYALVLMLSLVGLASVSYQRHSVQAGWTRAARELYASENRNAMCSQLVDQCCK